MLKSFLFILAAIASIVAFMPQANAVVCARGVYRAGCAGPRGAVVTGRPVSAPRAVYRRW